MKRTEGTVTKEAGMFAGRRGGTQGFLGTVEEGGLFNRLDPGCPD